MSVLPDNEILTVRIISEEQEKAKKYVIFVMDAFGILPAVIATIFFRAWEIFLLLLPILLLPLFLLRIKTDETVAISASGVTNYAPSRKIEKTIRWEDVRYARVTSVYVGREATPTQPAEKAYLLYPAKHFHSKLDAHLFDDATVRSIFKNPRLYYLPILPETTALLQEKGIELLPR